MRGRTKPSSHPRFIDWGPELQTDKMTIIERKSFEHTSHKYTGKSRDK